MENGDNIQNQVNELRQRTLHVIQELAAKSSQFDLSPLPEPLAAYQKKIVANA